MIGIIIKSMLFQLPSQNACCKKRQSYSYSQDVLDLSPISPPVSKSVLHKVQFLRVCYDSQRVLLALSRLAIFGADS